MQSMTPSMAQLFDLKITKMFNPIALLRLIVKPITLQCRLSSRPSCIFIVSYFAACKLVTVDTDVQSHANTCPSILVCTQMAYNLHII